MSQKERVFNGMMFLFHSKCFELLRSSHNSRSDAVVVELFSLPQCNFTPCIPVLFQFIALQTHSSLLLVSLYILYRAYWLLYTLYLHLAIYIYKLNISSLPFYCSLMPLNLSSVESQLYIQHLPLVANENCLAFLVKISDTVFFHIFQQEFVKNHIALHPQRPSGSQSGQEK